MIRVATLLNLLVAGLAVAQIQSHDLYSVIPPSNTTLNTFNDPICSYGGSVVASVYANFSTNGVFPYVWTTANPSGAAVQPAGAAGKVAYAIHGSQIVGVTYGVETNTPYAQIYAATAVDLSGGTIGSWAYGTDGNVQVGGRSGGVPRACMWSGTATSAVDLNGTLYSSMAYGVGGGQEVGAGSSTFNSPTHAFLWNGTSNAGQDLNPAGFTSSTAVACDGTIQGGSGTINSVTHALMWTGSSATAVDLNPGATGSAVLAVGNGYEAGTATIGGQTHAYLWTGSAASAVDLQSSLASAFTSSSATSILGNTVYGIAFNSTDAHYHSVSWTIPEPTTLLPVSSLLMISRRGRRRTRRQDVLRHARQEEPLIRAITELVRNRCGDAAVK